MGEGDAAAATAGVEVTTMTDVPPLGSVTKEVITGAGAVGDGVSDVVVDSIVEEEDEVDVVDDVEDGVGEGADELVTDALEKMDEYQRMVASCERDGDSHC